MPALMTSWTDEMRLMHHAPGLGGIALHVHVVFRDADFDVMDVEDDPWLPGIFHDPIPRTPSQTFFFRALPAAAGPSKIGHSSLQ
jgi:hypothetical protein